MSKEVKGNEDEYFIHFNSKDKKATTKTGCNNMFSTYTLKDDHAIKIKPLASTMKYCDNNIEIDYSQQLEKVDNYTISQDGKKLNLNIAKMNVAEYELIK